jgi:hypothetical protein
LQKQLLLFEEGLVCDYNPNSKKNEETEDDKETSQKEKKKLDVIAVIKFTCWEDLAEKDQDYLNFLSQFLHGSKKFINPVKYSSCSWGGKM